MHSPTYVPPRSKAAGKTGTQALMVITSKAMPGEPDTVKALLAVAAAVPKKHSRFRRGHCSDTGVFFIGYFFEKSEPSFGWG